MVGRGILQVLLYELISALFLRRLNDRRTPLFRTVLDPIQELVGNVGQAMVSDSHPITVRVEETQHPFRLLEGLDQPIQQETVEAPVCEVDAILVVQKKGVHRNLQCGETPGA
jgi:hypothetical protein